MKRSTYNNNNNNTPLGLLLGRLLVFVFLVVPTTTITPVDALNVVVLNQGGPEALALCIAKRCADHLSSSSSSSVSFVSGSDATTQKRQSLLLYGRPTDPEESTRCSVKDRVRLVAGGDAIAAALQTSDAFVVVSVERPVDAAALKPAFAYATPSLLKKVVLVSRMDASGQGQKGGGGFFGFGTSPNYRQAEDEFQTLVRSTRSSSGDSAALAILRCGTLKGGGPGYSNLGGRLEDSVGKPELGLSSVFYKTNADLQSAMISIAHDKFALGLGISDDAGCLQPGDPHTMPNIWFQQGNKDSFQPSPVETNVCTAAVVTTALLMETDVSLFWNKSDADNVTELSLGCEKGETLPTVDDATELIRKALFMRQEE